MRLIIQQAVHHTLAVVLAQGPPSSNDPGGQGADFGKSSPVGLLLLILFAIAVVFLVRSMTKHLKKLPTTFDEKRAAATAPPRARREATDEDAAAEDAEADEPDGGEDSATSERASPEPDEAKRENGSEQRA
jgi:hypothetical protein